MAPAHGTRHDRKDADLDAHHTSLKQRAALQCSSRNRLAFTTPAFVPAFWVHDGMRQAHATETLHDGTPVLLLLGARKLLQHVLQGGQRQVQPVHVMLTEGGHAHFGIARYISSRGL